MKGFKNVMGANKVFLCLLLSFIIALVGLSTLFVKTIPLLLSHAVYLCQETFSNVIFSISHSVPLVVIILIVTILLIGLITLAIQVRKARTYLKKHLMKKLSIPTTLQKLTQELDLADKIDIVKDKNKLSFCYGLIRPRICLSTGLIKNLSKNEIRAILIHESYHIKSRDPLKIILGKTASLMFFFLPIIGDIQNFYVLIKEIAADELAIKDGNRKHLLSVLSKLLETERLRLAGVAALDSSDLEKRIFYLTSEKEKVIFKPSLTGILLSSLVIVFTLVIVNTPVYALNSQETAQNSLFICPFGDSCTTSCKSKVEKNFSENILYTPVEGH